MIQSCKLGDLAPNPFRHLETYPIFREKVETLKESVKTTGLWPRLMGRRKANKIQICYGHHLRQALLELYAPSHLVEIEVRDFSDAEMLMVMSRENLEQYGADPLVYLQTVSATLEAYGNGTIALEPVNPKTSGLRQAEGHYYNALSLGKFLGWMKPSAQPHERIYWVLDALDLIEAKFLRPEELRGLNTTQAQELIRELIRRKDIQERAAKEAEAEALRAAQEAQETKDDALRLAAKERLEGAQKRARSLRENSKSQSRHLLDTIGKELRAGEIGSREIRQRAAEELGSAFAAAANSGNGFQKRMPMISQFARQLASSVERMFSADNVHAVKMTELIECRSQLDKLSKDLLVGAIRALIERLTRLADALDQPTHTGPRHPKSAEPRRIK
jgi:hypothetical protein